ncbi:hypothetical protein [Mucilaginibacter sp. OK283]|jgi:hypothetical protein|uniref:hypothetical protein n=1 Tax=Mucilaginibacter sp. OK283 TaxID=1881049 RepID=UPI0008B72521|nr:hypothetical protein [Mucilaginibacter sp. OK283]SEP22001.1 hypothetical protein SAMN05428947_108261 [Mucilaginibacter sp. OK283]
MAKHKLGNPVFIAAVLLLIVNDWYFKQTFHNDLTGKLSDFAGLFALPFLLSALFPRKIKLVYFFTLLFFIVWKSPLMQPVINALNGAGVPIHRTIDYTDYIALLILPVSFYQFNKQAEYHFKPVILNMLVVGCLISFIATTMPPGAYTRFNNINKVYTFNFSKRELVSRINALQLDYVHDFNKYVQDNNKHSYGALYKDTARVDFDSRSNIFYYSSSLIKNKRDTLAMLIDYERVKDADTIVLKTMYASLNISGNNNTSQLKLLNLTNYVRKSEKGDHKEIAVRIFEKFTLKKISTSWR